MQRKKDTGPSKGPRWLVPTAFVVGIIFVLRILDLNVGIPAPTPSQFTVFRIVIASGGAAVVGPALRFAITAPPFGLRRATLRAGPTTKKEPETKPKKGTLLTR